MTNEATCWVSVMNASHQEWSKKYEVVKEALEKEKQEKLCLQERVKDLEQNSMESNAASAGLAQVLKQKKRR